MAFSSHAGQDPAVGAGARLQQILSAVWRNPFSELALDGIDLDVTVTAGVRAYQVESVSYDRVAVRPGAIVPVALGLRRYRGASETRRVEVPIPEHLAPEASLSIAVGPPDYIDQLLGQALTRRLRSARDMGSAIAALHDLGSAHRLQVVLLRSTRHAG
jgi:hypothetical protein